MSGLTFLMSIPQKWCEVSGNCAGSTGRALCRFSHAISLTRESEMSRSVAFEARGDAPGLGHVGCAGAGAIPSPSYPGAGDQ